MNFKTPKSNRKQLGLKPSEKIEKSNYIMNTFAQLTKLSQTCSKSKGNQADSPPDSSHSFDSSDSSSDDSNAYNDHGSSYLSDSKCSNTSDCTSSSQEDRQVQ